MEQDNKTMSAEELIRYIEDNNLELQMLDILFFNDCGFEFAPVYKPRLSMSGEDNMYYSLLNYEDINIFSSDYQLPCFMIPDEIRPKNWSRYINHPEHLRAYMIRYKNSVKGELIYSRSSDIASRIRNDAFRDFVEYSGISSIKDFRKLSRKAAKKRDNQERHGFVNEIYINYVNIVFDEHVLASINNSHEDKDEITKAYCVRFFEAENAIYYKRYISAEIWLSTPDKVIDSVISFFAEFVPLPDIKTPLNQNFVIINSEEQIPNILYKIAIETDSDVFLAATGYVYDSGIQMLLPTIICTTGINRPHNIELIVGDLQNYRPDVKQQCMNRKTAEKINRVFGWKGHHLYTCPDSFYHGKFYYISNGKISYVIVGSSNITESAYTKNRELDVMFRFERGEDGKPCEREQMFLDWYADLKEKCVEIPRLDETLFSSNLLIDEAGNSSSSSILKKLTSEEEKDRYRFLESLCPSSVDEKMFYKKKEFKAFKGYIAFYYPENNITVLESFQYGNSCFVFGTTDEERIRMALARKSKEQVKQSDIYISNVNHDEDYRSELRQIFGK